MKYLYSNRMSSKGPVLTCLSNTLILEREREKKQSNEHQNFVLFEILKIVGKKTHFWANLFLFFHLFKESLRLITLMLSRFSSRFTSSLHRNVRYCTTTTTPANLVRIGHPAPYFKCNALVKDHFKEVTLDDYKGRWLVLFFYPLVFTFVTTSFFVFFFLPTIPERRS